VNLDLRSTLRPRGVPGEAPGELPVGAGGIYSDTAGHSRRVRCIALALARELGLESGQLAAVGQAALFHDIGKLAIPEAILDKCGHLTDEEWVLMRSHSVEGARMLEATGSFEAAVPAVRHHHERYDGTGYPSGLAGEEIPLAARVVHVADALDSMLTTRIYRAARPAHEAIQELREGVDAQFCPRSVQALERLLEKGALPEHTARLGQLLATA
jgi:putative nucleotidyltransferase with HDIG domain